MSNASRWLILLALVYAPWAYGCTRPWAIAGLNGLLAVTLALWILVCLVRRTGPQVPRGLAWATGWLVVQAWWMALNGKHDFAGADTFLGYDLTQSIELTPLAAWAPGSCHKELSWAAALRVTLLLGVVCFICDLARHSVWRRRLLWTMAFTGISIVTLGLAQRVTQAPSIFWRHDSLGHLFFATFRYHANAGAFINLAWPVLAALFAIEFARHTPSPRKYWLGAALVLCFTGALVNTSRASGLLALGLAGLWLAWFVVQALRDRLAGVHPATVVVTTILLVLLAGSVAVLTGFNYTLERWARAEQVFSPQYSRWLAAAVCWHMLPEAGWWGFGPGTFQSVFPFFTGPLGDRIAGVWYFAHNDYLQTLIEWGYLGSAAWAVVVVGALVTAGRQMRRHREHLPLRKHAVFFALLTALIGVLVHALADFPLQIASLQLYVAVFVGLFWGARAWLVPQPRARQGAQVLPFPERQALAVMRTAEAG